MLLLIIILLLIIYCYKVLYSISKNIKNVINVYKWLINYIYHFYYQVILHDVWLVTLSCSIDSKVSANPDLFTVLC